MSSSPKPLWFEYFWLAQRPWLDSLGHSWMALWASLPHGAPVRFRYRNTFIEVDAPIRQSPPLATSRLRSSTVPRARGERAEPLAEVFDVQRSSVSRLSGRMNRLWDACSAAETLGAPQVALMALRDFFGQAPDTGAGFSESGGASRADAGRRVDADPHLRTRSASPPNHTIEEEREVSLTPDADDAVDAHALAGASSPMMEELGDQSESAGSSGGADSSSSSFGRIGAASSSCAPADGHVETRAINSGTVGHPELCAKPCLHAAAGRCANGDACEFCHMPHVKKAKQLDKRQREAFGAMPPLEARILMLAILREKLLSVDDSPESVADFERLVSACGISSAVLSTRRTPIDRRMLVTLKSKSLRHLLAVFQSLVVVEGSQHMLLLVEALLAGLQQRAVARWDAEGLERVASSSAVDL